MDPKQIVILVSFVICCFGIAIGCVLGLAGIWIKDFGEVGWKLFMSDLVVTAAAILVAVLTHVFWK